MNSTELSELRKKAYQEAKMRKQQDPQFVAYKEELKRKRKEYNQKIKEQRKQYKKAELEQKRAEKDAALMKMLSFAPSFSASPTEEVDLSLQKSLKI